VFVDEVGTRWYHPLNLVLAGTRHQQEGASWREQLQTSFPKTAPEEIECAS
jgi:hypothetical protein